MEVVPPGSCSASGHRGFPTTGMKRAELDYFPRGELWW